MVRSCCWALLEEEDEELLLGFTRGEEFLPSFIQGVDYPALSSFIHKLVWLFAPLATGIFSSLSLLVSLALYRVFWMYLLFPARHVPILTRSGGCCPWTKSMRISRSRAPTTREG